VVTIDRAARLRVIQRSHLAVEPDALPLVTM
jgi:hypothetical protein